MPVTLSGSTRLDGTLGKVDVRNHLDLGEGRGVPSPPQVEDEDDQSYIFQQLTHFERVLPLSMRCLKGPPSLIKMRSLPECLSEFWPILTVRL
jgi:hypothetical protein